MSGKLLILSLAGWCGLQAGIILNTNALTNGNAESSAGSSDGNTGGAITGWTAGGANSPIAVLWSCCGANFPQSGDPGGSSGGKNFFAGGPFSSNTSMSQSIDVSNIAALIDAGLIQYTASGLLGGWTTQNDQAVINLVFLNGSNSALGSGATVAGPLAVERSNATGLLPKSTTGFLPTGTRTVNFVVNFNYTAGGYNDGYADNLSFVATQVGNFNAPTSTPEPSTFALLGGGLGVAAMIRRRKAAK